MRATNTLDPDDGRNRFRVQHVGALLPMLRIPKNITYLDWHVLQPLPLIDWTFSTTKPWRITADTAVDQPYTCTIEAYVSSKAFEYTDASRSSCHARHS